MICMLVFRYDIDSSKVSSCYTHQYEHKVRYELRRKYRDHCFEREAEGRHAEVYEDECEHEATAI